MSFANATRYWPLFVVIQIGPACSSQKAAGPGLASSQAATVALTSNDMYTALKSLPHSGEGSVAAFYDNIGRMTFAQYYESQATTAVDAAVTIDGRALGNPRQMWTNRKAQFLAASAQFQTIGDFWQATGSKPAALGTAADYQVAMQSVLPGTGTSLSLLTGNCNLKSLPSDPAEKMKILAAALALMQLTPERRTANWVRTGDPNNSGPARPTGAEAASSSSGSSSTSISGQRPYYLPNTTAAQARGQRRVINVPVITEENVSNTAFPATTTTNNGAGATTAAAEGTPDASGGTCEASEDGSGPNG